MYNHYQNMYPNMYASPYQERLVTMEQQNQSNQFRMMLVSNIEEANATPVDTLNGIPSFFYNKATDEIYMKQFNSVSGGAIFHIYKHQASASKADDPLKAINEKIDGLYELLKPKKEQKNDKSNDDITTASSL
nr:MAG TPA: hypothetical protein [Caudoviricetes sp.]